MPDSTTLRTDPCPFCASEKTKIEIRKGPISYKRRGTLAVWQTQSVYVRCKSCHARGPLITMIKACDGSVSWKDASAELSSITEQAVEGWNCRPDVVNIHKKPDDEELSGPAYRPLPPSVYAK